MNNDNDSLITFEVNVTVTWLGKLDKSHLINGNELTGLATTKGSFKKLGRERRARVGYK